MSDPKDLQDKLKHLRIGIEEARARIEDASNVLQNARPYLRDLLGGEALLTNPDARAATITSVWQAIDSIERDLQKLNELRLELLRDLTRLSG
jgi:hypothetical protein